MNTVLIVLSAVVVGCLAQYYPGGAPAPVQDTPEVAAAKAAHFQLVSQANAHKAGGPPQSYNQGGNYNQGANYNNNNNAGTYNGQFGYAGVPNNQYNGAPAQYSGQYNPQPAPYSGQYNPQPSAYQGQSYSGPTGGYQGPLAGVPKLTSLGVPVDTPEVQAARAAALSAHSGGPQGYNQGAPHYG